MPRARFYSHDGARKVGAIPPSAVERGSNSLYLLPVSWATVARFQSLYAGLDCLERRFKAANIDLRYSKPTPTVEILVAYDL
jgi:hypothetical protein